MGAGSDSIVLADVAVDVSLLLFTRNPVLVITHIEEGLVWVLASGVVRIDIVFLACLVLRLFDVPEDVLGHFLQDLGVKRLG